MAGARIAFRRIIHCTVMLPAMRQLGEPPYVRGGHWIWGFQGWVGCGQSSFVSFSPFFFPLDSWAIFISGKPSQPRLTRWRMTVCRVRLGQASGERRGESDLRGRIVYGPAARHLGSPSRQETSHVPTSQLKKPHYLCSESHVRRDTPWQDAIVLQHPNVNGLVSLCLYLNHDDLTDIKSQPPCS